MKRLFASCVLLFVTAFSASAQPSNLGYWTVNVLLNVERGRDWTARQTFDAIAIFKGPQLLRQTLAHPRLNVREILDADKFYDLYGALQDLYSEPFQCIIVTGLDAVQLIAVQQFAQDRGVVIVSTDAKVRTAPFAIEKEAVYGRVKAAQAYGFRLKSGPRDVILIEEEPPADLEQLVKCLPDVSYAELATWRAEDICYGNALGKLRNDPAATRELAVEELALAVIWNFVEAIDHSRFARGWGFTSYFPHQELALVLTQVDRTKRNCDAVARELRHVHRSVTEAKKREIQSRCPLRSAELLDGVAARIPAEERDLADGQRESLLPLTQQQVRWEGILSFD